MLERIRLLFIATAAGLIGQACYAVATPLEDCGPSTVPVVCLDAKLKAANQRLNVALKSAQEKIEKLQADRRRPVLGAFIDSQRKFNAYRDAQCTWQSINAAPGQSGLEFVKDCQIRETLLREQALQAFVAGNDEAAGLVAGSVPGPAAAAAEISAPAAASAPVAASDPTPAAPVADEKPKSQPAAVDTAPATVAPAPPVPAQEVAAAPAATREPAAAKRGFEWRLSRWVANGVEKAILPESGVSIAFDPSGKVSGQASVNRYSGSFRFSSDGRLEWSRAGFAVTRMAGSPALMAQEHAFLESLRRTVNYRVEGSELVLESTNGATVLTFTR
jgi:heat shock protein HslJ/uncharacterized protein YecT (DUF1311 family)